MILTIQCLSLKENKDAIVDQFRNVTNQRLNIDTENPDMSLNFTYTNSL